MEFSYLHWSPHSHPMKTLRSASLPFFRELFPHRIPFIRHPPPQDSPNHILNALSDELFQRILGYLINDVRDFLSAAETCKKFQENAKKCFPSVYKDSYIGYDAKWNGDSSTSYPVLDFLNIFGHLIRSINWDASYSFNKSEKDNAIFNAIAKFCGKNLLGLRIMGHNVDFNMGSQFLALEELILIESCVNHFKPPSTLKKLRLGSRTTTNYLTWMSQTYSNLSEISFQTDQLNDDVLLEFQAFNPQLKFFQIGYCKNITSSVLNGIAMRLPNLTGLMYNFSFEGANAVALQRKLEYDILHLGELRQLKLLNAEQNISNCLILDSLAAINAPLEELSRVSGQNPGMVESLCKLKNMRKLHLYYFGASMVVDIAKNLPNLIHMEIRYAHMTLNEVIQILEHGRNLKCVFIQDDHIKVDSDILLDSILNLARGRTQVVLSVSNSNILISPQRFYHTDVRKWLDIQSIDTFKLTIF